MSRQRKRDTERATKRAEKKTRAPLELPETTDPAGRWARRLIEHRGALLVVAIFFATFTWPWATSLQLRESIVTLFPSERHDVSAYQRWRRTRHDEFVLAAYRDPAWPADDSRRRLNELTIQLRDVAGVAAVFSLAGEQELAPQWRAALLKISNGLTYNREHSVLAVVCMLKPDDGDEVPRRDTIARVRQVMQRHDSQGVIAGEPALVVDAMVQLERDVRWLSGGLFLGAVGILVIVSRSLRWGVIAVLVLLLTTCGAAAAMALAGFNLSLLSVLMLPLIILFATTKLLYLQQLMQTHLSRSATVSTGVFNALREALGPLAATCLAGAAAVSVLVASSLDSVQSVGVFAAAGAVSTAIACVTLIPALSLLFRSRQVNANVASAPPPKIPSLTIDYRPLALVVLLTFVALPGLWRYRSQTNPFMAFRPDSSIIAADEFVERYFGGAGLWDVVIPLPEKADPQFGKTLRRLQQRLRDEGVVLDEHGNSSPGVTMVLGPLDVLDRVLPEPVNDSQQIYQMISLSQKNAPLFHLLYGRDTEARSNYLRVMLRSPQTLPTAVKQSLIDRVRRVCREEISTAEVGGSFVLLAEWGNRTHRRLLPLLCNAMFILMVVGCIILRSVRWSLVMVMLTPLPLIWLWGLLGWLEVRVDMGSAIAAGLAPALLCDGVLLFLLGYQRRRSSGDTVEAALTAVLDEQHWLWNVQTLFLLAGWGSLALCDFSAIRNLGLLMAAASALTLIVNRKVLGPTVALAERLMPPKY